jgi:hypothetical protein
MGASRMNTKTCKVCEVEFEPRRPLQSVCTLPCALLQSRAKTAKKMEKIQRAETRAARERLKTKSQWLKETQQVVNRYVRLRDSGKPCISCDWPDDGSQQRHASHYRSVGAAPELRFDTEHNLFTSCAQCNTMKSGNVLEYRIRLKKLIGDEALDALEGPHPPAKYTIEGIKAIKAAYLQKIKEIS